MPEEPEQTKIIKVLKQRARKTPLTTGDFEDWARDVKESFTGIEERLEEHTQRLIAIDEKLGEHTNRLAAIEKKLNPLEQIATSLKNIETNTASMLKLYRRVDHRTEKLAEHVGLDLSKVDAET